MQIVLMRHGKPGIGRQRWLNAADFGAWIEKYNASGIDGGDAPPPAAIGQARRCAVTVCSHLPRSLESAKALGIERAAVGDATFRELDMPHAKWRYPKLPLPMWLAFFRLAWVLGYSPGVESFDAARERARACAEELMRLARMHGSVLFVGHGALNWYLAKHLEKLGCPTSGQRARRYWEFSVHHVRTA